MTDSRKLVALLALGTCLGCGRPAASPSSPQPEAPLITVDGEVLGVDRVPAADRLASGPRLQLEQADRVTFAVELAPDWYLDRQGLRFAP